MSELLANFMFNIRMEIIRLTHKSTFSMESPTIVEHI